MTQKMPFVDAATLRQLAVEGDVDPRSLRKLLAGRTVRGMAGRRATLVLRQAGLLGDSKPVEGPTERQGTNPNGLRNKP